MRTGLWISLLLLGATLALGWWEACENRELSRRYVSAAEELRTLTDMEDWTRAADVVTDYIEDWQHTVPWLQILINHEDIDDVTLALVRLQSAIRAQEKSACYEACAELKENARHIYHRDALTLGNVL
ncbi:MAG: DUF4363 family protein [Clostridia bacterium]|nr:DUF4363 family protein [Clostridia bacterium]